MKNLDEINKLINKKIQEAATYNGKRWKRGYWNQVGVYDVKLNISQIHIIHEALKKVKYQKHLKKHWDHLFLQVVEDYRKRTKKYDAEEDINKIYEERKNNENKFI